MHVRIDDTVEVITGEDAGTRGRVLRVDRAAGKVVGRILPGGLRG